MIKNQTKKVESIENEEIIIAIAMRLTKLIITTVIMKTIIIMIMRTKIGNRKKL